MVVLGKLFSEDEGYFQLRKTSKLISEVLIAISCIVGLSSIGTLIDLGLELRQMQGEANARKQKEITFALFIYTILILIASISDVIFAIILNLGIRKLRLSFCLLWRGATITSLIVVGILTLAFIAMVQDLILMLGYLPSLVSKPFSLWIVSAFMAELGALSSFPFSSSTALPPARPSFSLDDIETLKQTTTVYHMKHKFGKRKFSQNPYILNSKLVSIPEAERE